MFLILFASLLHVNVTVVFMDLLPVPEVQEIPQHNTHELVSGLYLGFL